MEDSFYDFPCLGLDGIRLQLVYRSRVPLLVVLVEVEGGVPQGAVHVDVLPHGLQHGVRAGVPVQVGLLLVNLVQLRHRLRHRCVESRRKCFKLCNRG